jgi:hypothetical protein
MVVEKIPTFWKPGVLELDNARLDCWLALLRIATGVGVGPRRCGYVEKSGAIDVNHAGRFSQPVVFRILDDA